MGGFNLSGNFAGGPAGSVTGGFGGGGGGAPSSYSMGGGGGGYTGGQGVSVGPATGGTSYVAQSGSNVSLQGSTTTGSGRIEITGSRAGAQISATQALYDTTQGSNFDALASGPGDTFGYSFTTQGQAVLLTSITFGVFDPGGGSGSMEVSLRANSADNTPGTQLTSFGSISGDTLRDGVGTRVNKSGLSYRLEANTTYWIIGANDANSALRAAVNRDATGGIGDAYGYGRFYSAKTNASRSLYNHDFNRDTLPNGQGFPAAQVGRVTVTTFVSGYVGVTAGTRYDPANAVDQALTVYTDPGLSYTARLSGSTLTINNGTASQAIALGDGARALQLDFSPNTGAVELDGGGFGDVLRGGSGADTLQGGDGDDLLEGGAGADALFGQSFSSDPDTGSDTVSYAGSGAGVTVDLGLQQPQTSAGDASNDVLVGIENLTGSAFDDSLTGDANANVLVGGAGSDTLQGGAGDDILDGGVGGDYLFGQKVFETDTGSDTVTYARSSAGVTVDLTLINGQVSAGDANGDFLVGIENLTGSDFADTLTGDANANNLVGGFGSDVLRAGSDSVADRLNGGSGEDTLYGGVNDILMGVGGNDTFFIDGSANKVLGGSGKDTLFITGDVAFAAGDLIRDVETVILDTSGGARTADFSALTDRAGLNLSVQGDAQALITGSQGNDTFRMGTGGGTITSSRGRDVLALGDGTDVLAIADRHGRLDIRSFDLARDRIDVSAFGATSLADLNVRQVGAKTVLGIAGDTASASARIVFWDMDAAALRTSGAFDYAT